MLPDASEDRRVLDFDPYWNHGARWLAFYVGPFGLLLAGVRLGLIDLESRDFWVPLLWGLWMPWFNGRGTPFRGLKKWVFRDFNQNEYWPLGVPTFHAVTWSFGVSLLGTPLAAVCFVAALLLYDAFMLKFGLLDMYVLPERVLDSGWASHLPHFVGWWLYVAAGFWLSHAFGADTPLFMLGFTAGWILPMQLFVHVWTHRPRTRLKLETVAVVGAGWSGLYATKWLKQMGLKVETFEKGKALGGVWRYRATPGGVASGTFASSSKHFMHASDFPMGEALPMFPTHSQVLRFLEDYSSHFQLDECMRFGSEVRHVEKGAGTWTLRIATASGEITREFDAVVVTAGANAEPRGSGYPGFEGGTRHAGDFKDAASIDRFERVLVVGVGESGADIAHECAQRGSAEIFWSGGPQWFADRYVGGPFAADSFMAPGMRTVLAKVLNLEDVGRRIIQSGISFFWGQGGSGLPAWQPRNPWLHSFVTKSRDAIVDVHQGLITPKGSIDSCSGKRVRFQDGSEEVFDQIIDCTGYAPRFDFLGGRYEPLDHYKLVFDPEDPSMAFVGMVRPVLGSIPALAELQARWVGAVFSGAAVLPAPEQMRNEMRFRKRIHRKRFDGSLKRPNLVDHDFYASEVAEELGIGVPWLKLLFLHPVFFFKLLTAPWHAFKYNLARPDTRGAAIAHTLANRPPSGAPFYVNASVFLAQGLVVATVSAAMVAMLILRAHPVLWIFCALMLFVHVLLERLDSRLP